MSSRKVERRSATELKLAGPRQTARHDYFGGSMMFNFIIAGPFVLFPFSKLLWLAFDLMRRLLTPEEMEWHHSEKKEWSTD